MTVATVGILGFALGCLVAAAVLRNQAVGAARRAAESAAAAARSAAESAAAAQQPAPVKGRRTPPGKAVSPTTRPTSKPTSKRASKPASKPAPAKAPKPAPAPASEPRPARAGSSEPAAESPPPEDSPVTDDGLPRLDRVPVPRDRPGPVPRRREGERHHYSGVWDKPTEREFPIERPEPEAVTIALVEASAEHGHVTITPMTRTPTRVETHANLLFHYSATERGTARTVVSRDVTHLKVESSGDCEWSVRLFGPSEIDELLRERDGSGDAVLMVRPDAPAELVVHVNSSSWQVRFVCGCWRADRYGTCKCPLPPGWTSRGSTFASASGEAMRTVAVPRPGLLVLRTSEPTDPWRLHLRPRGPEQEDE
ncbi:hypothetical protein [Streptomyces sp. BE303]|uniref:hypothetical protein n=1 Tax=Streptomyces sp. BE303 TaxID=3002528 RepID=UPI002E768BFD|nr:hypothetical protein [Streptomyces sp. BE303]MED7952909.1 hypothetical protein [Streptomyces sp. BE303]